MGYKIEEIEGVGPKYGAKLAAAGIRTTDQLLAQCCDAKGRKAMAAKTDFSTKQLLKWANMADLMRISGIGSEYSELLEAAGVDTVKELATRRSDNLAAKMAQVNETKKLTRAVPSEAVVAKWVTHAKSLDALITH